MQLDLFPKIGQTPNWKPIESFCERYYGDLIEYMHISNFMWMFSWGDVQCYKHKTSRGYINIDSKGKYYRYSANDGEYYKISAYEAIKGLKGLKAMRGY